MGKYPRFDDYLWTFEDVMSYFGEYISETQALGLMSYVETMPDVGGFSDRMNEVRYLIRYRLGIKDVPVCLGYRRIKNVE